MRSIVLASLSPRRKELLKQLNIPFIVDSQNQEEVMNEQLPLELRLEDLAYQKAKPMLDKYPDAIIIGADTIVCFQNHILGKPKDREEAKQMLLRFSNHSQYVYTAVTVLEQNKRISFCEKSEVVFKSLDLPMIEDYLNENEWQDKAGGYAIQGKGAALIDHYTGDFDTIVGLPVKRLKEVLMNEIGISKQKIF